MSEKDWLVWKFQVQHAPKAAGQWEFITGAAMQLYGLRMKKDTRIYEHLRQLDSYLIT